MTIPIPKANTVAVADTSPSGNSIVLRDASGNIQANGIQGSGLETTGSYTESTSTQTTDFTADESAVTWFCDCTAGAIAVTLPSASAFRGLVLWFIKTDSGSNHVTFSGVTGTSSLTTQGQAARAISDGTNWYVH